MAQYTTTKYANTYSIAMHKSNLYKSLLLLYEKFPQLLERLYQENDESIAPRAAALVLFIAGADVLFSL